MEILLIIIAVILSSICHVLSSISAALYEINDAYQAKRHNQW